MTPVADRSDIRPHFRHFDALRGVAVLVVLVFHSALITDEVGRGVIGHFTVIAGDIGVTVFFVISGFLLYRPHVAARTAGLPAPALGRYARRRIGRIVPPYWAALTVLAIFPGIAGVFSGDFWKYYLFLQIYWQDTLGLGIPVAWTLCVEVSFYILLPFYALAMRRRTPTVDLTCLALIALGGIIVQLLAVRHRIDALLETTLLGQAPYFAVGMALAILSVRGAGRLATAVERRSGELWIAAALAASGLALLAPSDGFAGMLLQLGAVQPYWKAIARIVLTVLFVTALVLPAVWGENAGGWPRRFLAWAPVAALGTISYSVYLYHLTLAQLIGLPSDHGHFRAGGLALAEHVPVIPTLAVFLATLAASALVGTTSWRLTERPFSHRRRR